MAKIYVIASGKGGTGKTTTAVNLGAAFNSFKQDVVVVDTNLTTPNLGLYFGAPVVPVNLNHVLQKKAEISEAVYEHDSGVKIIPSSLSLSDMKKINYTSLKDASKKLVKNFDYVIFDSSAGLGEESKMAIESGDEIIIVANPNILSVTDALKTIKFSEGMGKKVRGVIITRVKGERTEMPLSNIEEMLEVPVLGIVPEDNAVSDSLMRKNSVIHTSPGSRAARAYMDVAAKILGRKPRKLSFSEKLARLLGFR